jgi:RHS repeat-associated protein
MHGEEAYTQAEVTTLYHGNQQYSVTALSDSSGNVSERYAYTAYGQPTFLNASGTVQTSSAASNRYTYTGREWDSTLSLHHFRARWMSGLSGRFLSRDPIGFDGSEWDLYEQVESSPMSRTDPDGTITITPLHDFVDVSKSKCAGISLIQWRFRLSKKAKEICPNKTGGWMMQKVSISCSGEQCPKSKPCDPNSYPETKEYWEGWYIGPDEDTPSFNTDYTDQNSILSYSPSCGKFRMDGEVRFFCHKSKKSNMKPVTVAACGVTVTSIELPGTVTEPKPWKGGDGDDGVATRWHYRDWNCCPECPVPTKDDFADASPR